MSNLSKLPPTLNMQEFANILRVSPRTLKRWLKDKPCELPPEATRVGARRTWVTQVVFDWLSPQNRPAQEGWDGLLKK